MAIKVKQMNYAEQKMRKEKSACSRDESKKRRYIITSIKDKEGKLKDEEERIQGLKQAIGIMEQAETRLVNSIIQSP